MIETFCKDCGDRYPLGQDHECKKRPAKKSSGGSSAVERRVANAKAAGSIPARRSNKSTGNVGASAGRSHSAVHVPTESPASVPVDTILTTAEAAAAHLAPKHSGGRPKKHEDRKAYRAQKAREYRQRDKLKEGPRDA